MNSEIRYGTIVAIWQAITTQLTVFETQSLKIVDLTNIDELERLGKKHKEYLTQH